LSINKDIYAIVEQQIRKIDASREGPRRAALAKLRRGTGKPPGATPEIWEMTIGALPEDAGEYAENAIHIALTLYATHKQGTSINGLHGGNLGYAVTFLKNADSNAALTKRFNTAITSPTIEELETHIRPLVKMLKTKGIDLNYPKLAEDLYFWQFESTKEKICLEWGRSYWKANNREKQEENKNE